VVQLYIHDEVASVTQPVLLLKGLKRVSLHPGEQVTVCFSLGVEAFMIWNARMEEVVEPGEFTILAGSSSVDLKSVKLEII